MKWLLAAATLALLAAPEVARAGLHYSGEQNHQRQK